MKDSDETFDRAMQNLWARNVFRHNGRALTIATLIRSTDWRPLKAPWWRGKEVYLIGADLDGNFFLRHSDGSVRYWDHKQQTDIVLAPSIKDFAGRIET